MAGPRAEIIAGGIVVVAALAFVVHAGRTTGMIGTADHYELRASFRSVEGITVGSDVRVGGVKIGHVADVSLNPATFFADTRISVDRAFTFPEDSAILIASEGLLGGNYVEIMPGGMVSNLQPGDEIEDTQGAVSLTALLLKFVGGAAQDQMKAAP